MSGGYSGKFLQRQCKIQLFRDNLGEQKVLESAFFRLSEGLIFIFNFEPPTKFSKKRGLTGSQFLDGGCWERGGDFFQGGCSF